LQGEFLGRVTEAARLAEESLDAIYAETLEDIAYQTSWQQQLTVTLYEEELWQYVSFAVRANRPAEEIYRQILRWKGVLFGPVPGR
jgi:hypothetical protein